MTNENGQSEAWRRKKFLRAYLLSEDFLIGAGLRLGNKHALLCPDILVSFRDYVYTADFQRQWTRATVASAGIQ